MKGSRSVEATLHILILIYFYFVSGDGALISLIVFGVFCCSTIVRRGGVWGGVEWERLYAFANMFAATLWMIDLHLNASCGREGRSRKSWVPELERGACESRASKTNNH